MSRATLHIAVACCVLAACGAEPDPDAGPAAAGSPAADSMAADSAFTPAEDRVHLPTASIYYTLTRYDWYARGQPLIHEGRPYASAGMPINASLTEMEKAGEYQGVVYYSRRGERGALYVPVYEGYWQSFVADPATVTEEVEDVADPPALDTTGLG